jgi:hypothetical protein
LHGWKHIDDSVNSINDKKYHMDEMNQMMKLHNMDEMNQTTKWMKLPIWWNSQPLHGLNSQSLATQSWLQPIWVINFNDSTWKCLMVNVVKQEQLKAFANHQNNQTCLYRWHKLNFSKPDENAIIKAKSAHLGECF